MFISIMPSVTYFFEKRVLRTRVGKKLLIIKKFEICPISPFSIKPHAMGLEFQKFSIIEVLGGVGTLLQKGSDKLCRK
jgi:hypothetical protein